MTLTLTAFPEKFEENLYHWYDHHQRPLPWRLHPSPYAVLISEFMLQQTTVATVWPYFERWLLHFPTLDSLAAACEADVLVQWQGLGYYNRARNLHRTARLIMEKHGGKIPEDPQTLSTLPGIGPYTAAAIAAIAFHHPVIPVDGNIARVYARVMGNTMALPELKARLTPFFAKDHAIKRPNAFAQALMDLGATLCKPKKALCHDCPVRSLCYAYAHNRVETLPLTTPKKKIPQRHAWAFIIQNREGAIYLRQRPETGLLARMMEVPTTPWQETPLTLKEASAQLPGIIAPQALGQIHHTFTHFRLTVDIALVTLEQAPLDGFFTKDLTAQALPTLFKKILAFKKQPSPPLIF